MPELLGMIAQIQGNIFLSSKRLSQARLYATTDGKNIKRCLAY